MTDKTSSNRKLAIGLVIVVAVVVVGIAVYLGMPGAGGPPAEIKLGAIMYGLASETTWDMNVVNSLETVGEKYDVEIGYSESVDMARIESVLRSMSEEYTIIWPHSSSYEEFVKEVAPDYPDVYYLTEYTEDRGEDYYPQNVVCAAQDPKDGYFLAGVLAAKMSTTQKFGTIQAMDDPGDTLYTAAFRQGVHYVNPDAEVGRVIMGDYVKPVETRDAVKAYAAAGCDVVFDCMDDLSATMEAEAQGIYTIACYMDSTPQYPDTLLACSLWNFGAILDAMVGAVKNGTWDEYRATHWFNPLSLEDGSCGLGVYGNAVPQSVQDYVEDVKQKLISGEIVVQMIMEW